ncbi:hypothetical protein M0811_00860 [Anaeramoeba ignava]|uniref:DUF1015 domain-containing protein n=1 Tax=Anaeramoeba ignava TaxID=1746090 RepID=A0A9Q0RBI8_ANAIG|nr:hypothetical protein M0811_00860 [Anaeramoeba ignava]|eukprot:Anaeramoba_ignava/c6622_g1_i1.p1 GENE.c6622_g1_i1~~c6622_g1_i1.p1  ORF type:complete len:447 (+),score=141.68 c6622_g1_i1:27-1343(+)
MVKIKAFLGYSPPKSLEKKVPSPPYDVISSEEARKFAEGNEQCFLHVNKPEIDLPEDTNPYSDEVYKQAKINLDAFIEKGYLVKETQPQLYIYAQTRGNHTQKGYILLASIDDYEKGLIKKHEFTRKDKEEDRTKIINIQNANAGPVFLSYSSKQSLDDFLETLSKRDPDFDFFADWEGERHQVWKVSDKKIIESIQGEFDSVPALYICDGHHRMQSAANVAKMRKAEIEKNGGTVTGEEPFNFVMTVVFPHTQLAIFDYNRVLFKQKKKKEELMEFLKQSFDIKEVEKKENVPDNTITPPHYAKPTEKRVFSMYLDKKWYYLHVHKDKVDESDPVKSIDSQILTEQILTPFFGIQDLRSEKNIDFIGGTRGYQALQNLVDKNDAQKQNDEISVAFGIFPVTMLELMNVADSGRTMPPKSTWFLPKLLSGLVVRLIEN